MISLKQSPTLFQCIAKRLKCLPLPVLLLEKKDAGAIDFESQCAGEDVGNVVHLAEECSISILAESE